MSYVNFVYISMYNKIEDIIFSILLRIPKSLIPSFILMRLEHYLYQRVITLQCEIIRNQWKKIELDTTMNKIKTSQQY